MSPDPVDPPSRVGKFIQTYHSFLSTFVIGAAGLIATSIWQYRQSEIARHQAESQQQIATTQAENSWRIERAEILAKNLQVLATSGENTVEQRYGVLLSLTRGNILDPELAVSYALELGKDNADYMESVLANTANKSFARLASAFEPTCEQRFGLARDVHLCRTDIHSARSDAIADLFADEVEGARKRNELGPLVLLQDEHDVQTAPVRMAWLFATYLNTMYERRQWKAISDFEGTSNGARLVSALLLGPTPENELVAAGERNEIEKFHAVRVEWLLGYLLGTRCDAECKGRLGDFILTVHTRARGRFDPALRQLLGRPRAETTNVFGRLHSRLLACQLDPDDVPLLRDAVLLPSLGDALAESRPDNARLDVLLSVLALVPEPAPGPSADAWQAALAKARSALGEAFTGAYGNRRKEAETTRLKPTPNLSKAMFCSAAQLAPETSEFDVE